MTDSPPRNSLPGTGWHHEDIKAELRKRYGTMMALSRKLGVSRQSISGVLLNPLASTSLERKIAAALGVQPSAIWPNRWKLDGTPIPRSERSKMSQLIHQINE